MKQMFDISEKLIVGQSDEICGVTPIDWEDSSWKQLSLVNDKEVISLSHAKVYVFSDSVPRLGKVNQKPNIKYCLGRKVELVLDTVDGEPMEFEWQQSPRVHDQNGRSITIQRTNYLHVDVQ